VSFYRKRLRPRLLGLYALAGLAFWYASPTGTSIALGLVPIALGEAIRLWATGHLHKNDALTVTGVYAYVRHPLYLGTLLIAAGFLGMAHSALALVALAGLALFFFGYYLPYKDRIESARLESLYGDEFRRYSAVVPRVLPRLRPYVALGASPERQPAWRMARFADNNELGTAAAVCTGVLAMVVRWQIG
jgi:protein-S-isoprenylcysteine O-methyltransferase Ste14